MLWNLGVFGFVMWLPSIIRAASDLDIVQTGWLSAIPYLLASVSMIVASYFSDKTLNRRRFIWPFLAISGIAFCASCLVSEDNFFLSFVLLVIAGGSIYAPYGPFFASLTELIPRNVAGGAIALVNSFGALGSFVGAFVVGYLHGVTGSFTSSYLFMASALFIAALISLLGFNDKNERSVQ